MSFLITYLELCEILQLSHSWAQATFLVRHSHTWLVCDQHKVQSVSATGRSETFFRKLQMAPPSFLAWGVACRACPSCCRSPVLHRIIAMLSLDEQALFKERIRFLDKKIHPGLKKLHWALKGPSAFFITECRIHASKVRPRHLTRLT